MVGSTKYKSMKVCILHQYRDLSLSVSYPITVLTSVCLSVCLIVCNTSTVGMQQSTKCICLRTNCMYSSLSLRR